jgi:amino acid transporter
MADGGLTLTETVSMAIGGMVGGGIFAALGIVAVAADTLAWFAFVVAGLIAACAGYSFVRLNRLVGGNAGPMTYVERFTGSTTLAGMVGWTFVIGYVGTMSLYAFAFGGYFTELVGVASLFGVPLRPVVSVLVVGIFVGLNTAGAHASGRSEELLVGVKVLILLVFGVAGVYYGFTHGELVTGFEHFGVGPVVAGGLAFVAFEGWELLFFDQDSIENPERTVRNAVYIAIAAATGLYVLAAVVTTDLVPLPVIRRNADTALAVAARPFFGELGFALVAVAALFSTASALNATLFSSARLSKRMVADDFLPNRLRGSTGDEPTRLLVVLGLLTAAFVLVGSLDAITSFASLAFITIFGGMSALAFTQRDSLVTALVPGFGTVGAVAAVVSLLSHLFSTEFDTFVLVVALAVGVVAVELLYFEREPIAHELHEIEDSL